MTSRVRGGLANADTAKNGLGVLVTARGDRNTAEALAREIAQYGWDNRARLYPKLTPLDEAVEQAPPAGRDKAKPPLVLADVAGHPGGGGRRNTQFLVPPLAGARGKSGPVGIVLHPP